MHIGMAVFGDLRFDYRVFREAWSLRRAGHRISIVATAFHPEPLEGWEDFELHLIPLSRSRSLRLSYPVFWRRARQLLVGLDADAYHAHDLDALLPAARAAQHGDAALIYDSHEFWTEQSSLVGRGHIRAFWSYLERRLIRRVNHTIAVSPSIAAALRQRYHLEAVSVVRNLPLYRAPVPSDCIRATLGLESGRTIALYQGGFLSDNGLSEQIAAVGGLGDLALVLLGGGPTEAALKEQVRRAGLTESVFFIPRVPFDRLHAYTCSADIGLCLIKGTGKSFYYSLPNKLFEYMMAGLPVLASDFPEMRAVVRDTSAGELVDPQNLPLVRRRLRALIDDGERRRAYGRAALEAARRYNWEREAHTLVQLYARL